MSRVRVPYFWRSDRLVNIASCAYLLVHTIKKPFNGFPMKGLEKTKILI